MGSVALVWMCVFVRAPAASGLVSQSWGKFLLLEFWDPLQVPKGKVARKTLVVSAPILSLLNF